MGGEAGGGGADLSGFARAAGGPFAALGGWRRRVVVGFRSGLLQHTFSQVRTGEPGEDGGEDGGGRRR